MVCTHPNQRMAALARLLSNSQTVPDEFAHKKVAVQYIHRELREADEANLIDEKDMHIFDLEPMTDPLHLVSCNACRKPIKASQYALHAELCSSFPSIKEIVLELDGGKGPKKPPRKERKKLLAASSRQITSVAGAKFEILDASDISAPQALLENPSCGAKDCTVPLDGLGNGPESQNPNCLGSEMKRSRKRSKKIKAADPPPVMEHFEATNGVTSQGTLLGREAPGRATPESQTTSCHLNNYQIPRQVDDLCTRSKDIPVPLATKVYYSYGDCRLRTTLGHLYHYTSTMECTRQSPSEELCCPYVTQTLATASNNFSLNRTVEDNQEKEVQQYPDLVHKVDQSHAQNQNFAPANLLEFHHQV